MSAPVFTRRCTGCAHHGRRGTCLEPIGAGLIPAAEGFGITWPGTTHAATCPAWRQSPADAIAAVYEAAGRGGWPDALMNQWLADAAEFPEAVAYALRAGGPTP
jgi:hypothetical protein